MSSISDIDHTFWPELSGSFSIRLFLYFSQGGWWGEVFCVDFASSQAAAVWVSARKTGKSSRGMFLSSVSNRHIRGAGIPFFLLVAYKRLIPHVSYCQSHVSRVATVELDPKGYQLCLFSDVAMRCTVGFATPKD